MQPARFRQEDFLLVEINNAKSTSPAVSSGEERGLLSRTAAGNRAYLFPSLSLGYQLYFPQMRFVCFLLLNICVPLLLSLFLEILDVPLHLPLVQKFV